MHVEPFFEGCTESYLITEEGGNRSFFKVAKNQKDTKPLFEYLAYRLDIGGFAGVPQTSLRWIPIDGVMRFGAYRSYIEDAIQFCDLSHAEQLGISPECIRRVALFDLYTGNTDRHTGNLLLHRGRLVPIDHGYLFAPRGGGADLCWKDLPQAETPFSTDEREYIEALPFKTALKEWVMEGLSANQIAEKRFPELALY